ncbi:MAG: energy transducer TonB [Ginsengibacter sp.]
MRIFLIAIFLVFLYNCSSQKIIRAAMADDKGLTANQKKAKYLIIVKQYGDTAWERLDYNFSGPMITRSTFLDSNLTVLHGKYAEYRSTGYLSSDGQYYKNRKDGRWLVYDDTSLAVLEYKYHLDTLLSVTDLDSLSKEKKKLKEDTTGQVEARYIGGINNISKIIQSNLKVPDRLAALTKGGTDRIRFVIDTTGKPVDAEVLRSVEFTFDEESKRVILLLKDWVPASDKGVKLKAYRIQPITVVLE